MAPVGVEATETGEYKVKAAGFRTAVDHLFHSGTAAAVAFDISHILALKVGIIKKEQRKGYNLSQESRELLDHLVDTETVTDRDQVPLVVKHVGRMLDTFLQRRAPMFPALREMYDQRVIYCFRDSENFQQMRIDQVPGLQAIKDAHDSGKLFVTRRGGRHSKKLKESLAVFTFANQAGLDMLEATLVALQDISLDKILDENGLRRFFTDWSNYLTGLCYLLGYVS